MGVGVGGGRGGIPARLTSVNLLTTWPSICLIIRLLNMIAKFHSAN